MSDAVKPLPGHFQRGFHGRLPGYEAQSELRSGPKRNLLKTLRSQRTILPLALAPSRGEFDLDLGAERAFTGSGLAF
jgi:hypothetical protein